MKRAPPSREFVVALALPWVGTATPASGCTDVTSLDLDYAEVRFDDRKGDWAIVDGSATLVRNRDGFQFKTAVGVPLHGDQASGESQLRYFRSLGNGAILFAGPRIDFGPGDDIVMLMLGAGFDLPLGFGSEVLIFLDEDGHLQARTELVGTTSLLPRLKLQSRLEVNWSKQGTKLAAAHGPETLDAALRLGYQVTDRFTFYTGMIYGRAFGHAASELRSEGESEDAATLAVGISSAF